MTTELFATITLAFCLWFVVSFAAVGLWIVMCTIVQRVDRWRGSITADDR